MKRRVYTCPTCGVKTILPDPPVRNTGRLRCENGHTFRYRETGQSTLPAILAALLVAGLLFASVELGAARVAAALFAVGY